MSEGGGSHSGICDIIQSPKNAVRARIGPLSLGGPVYAEIPEDTWNGSLERAIVGQHPNDDDSYIKHNTRDGG